MTTETKPQRASLPELLEFANKVREAGGGNPLDALMPAVPADPKQCLIAKNLNFNCWVTTAYRGDMAPAEWMMFLDTEETRDKIAEKLDLEKYDGESGAVDEFNDDGQSFTVYGIVLPAEIGEVASDFDWVTHHCSAKAAERFPDRAKDFAEFLPYIEESIKEAQELAPVNEKGELIL